MRTRILILYLLLLAGVLFTYWNHRPPAEVGSTVETVIVGSDTQDFFVVGEDGPTTGGTMTITILEE